MLVLFGLSLAFALAFLSFVKVDFGNGFQLTYRENEQWESLSTLFVTDPEFSVELDGGRADRPRQLAGRGDATARAVSLASLYIQFATTDPILKLMARSGTDRRDRADLPRDLHGRRGRRAAADDDLQRDLAPPEGQAQRLSRRHVKAFLDYIAADQVRRGVAPEDRITVEVVRQPQKPTLLQPRKKTRPIVVFLTVAIATFGLAFILENMRPRVRAVRDQGGQTRTRRASMQSKRSRRTA